MSDSKFSQKKLGANTKIGNYLIGEVIGEGTFGKVRLAKHVPTNESVAIKILSKRKIEECGDTARVKTEIGILKKVNHPTI